MQNRRSEPTGLAKPGETRGLMRSGLGLTRQVSAGRVFGRVYNQTNPFLRFKPGPLAVYPDLLLTLGPTLQEAEAARNTSGVDVEQQLLGESAGGDSLPDGPLPDVPLPDVPLPDDPLPTVRIRDDSLHNVPLPDVCLREAGQDSTLGEERSSPRVGEEACVWVRVGFLPCGFLLL